LPTLTAFWKIRPECIPNGSKASLYASARPLVEEIGEIDTPKFIEWADEIMRKKELSVKDLRSYMWLVGEWRSMEHDPTKDKWGLCVRCHSSPCDCEEDTNE